MSHTVHTFLAIRRPALITHMSSCPSEFPDAPRRGKFTKSRAEQGMCCYLNPSELNPA